MATQRVLLTPTQLRVNDAGGAVRFDTANKYVKTAAANTFRLSPIASTPHIVNGNQLTDGGLPCAIEPTYAIASSYYNGQEFTGWALPFATSVIVVGSTRAATAGGGHPFDLMRSDYIGELFRKNAAGSYTRLYYLGFDAVALTQTGQFQSGIAWIITLLNTTNPSDRIVDSPTISLPAGESLVVRMAGPLPHGWSPNGDTLPFNAVPLTWTYTGDAAALPLTVTL